MTQLPSVLKALADPSRLRIVNILSHKPVCVCDLQSVLGLAQPFISRHLAYLRKVGLVRDQREGARVCYSLAVKDPFTDALRSFLREVLPLSRTFQIDLEKLIECGRSGRLKSSTVCSDFEPRVGRSEAEPAPLTSKAA